MCILIRISHFRGGKDSNIAKMRVEKWAVGILRKTERETQRKRSKRCKSSCLIGFRKHGGLQENQKGAGVSISLSEPWNDIWEHSNLKKRVVKVGLIKSYACDPAVTHWYHKLLIKGKYSDFQWRSVISSERPHDNKSFTWAHAHPAQTSEWEHWVQWLQIS